MREQERTVHGRRYKVVVELATVPESLQGPRLRVFVCLPNQPASFEWVSLYDKQITHESEEELWEKGWAIVEAYAYPVLPRD